MSEAGFAPAKVNLYLLVTGRRDDGYHLLDSLCVFAGAGDAVRAQRADALSLHIEGPFADRLSEDSDNLVLRAARLLAQAVGVAPVANITLDKSLPVASGIGGGSADAAATLRVLMDLWGVTLPVARLHDLALQLGADVPVCLASRPVRMEGVGEVLSDAPSLPAFGLVLVNPGVSVATPAVFRARQAVFSARAYLPRGWDTVQHMAADLAPLGNYLEDAARQLCPPIGDVLAALRAHPDVLLARMSGSGATCFGICATPVDAARVADALRRSDWWCWGGFTHGG